MKWYNEAIGYEIYPYSFMDSNNDGYGDLKGVISKLDYLQNLGVTLLWLCPVYKSPLDDYGYDVADFYEVNPLLGTNEELIELIKEAHKRGIRIIMDLVLNHVSSEHEWFKRAIKEPESRYHDYFIFHKPKLIDGKKSLPNNWMGFFSTSVWTYVEELDEYYFHIFSEKMPDLNWENPELRREMYDIARHYLDLGIDGFRLDAIAHLAKDTSFKDSPLSDGLVLDSRCFSNRERLFDYLAEFKKEVLDKYPDVLTIGEVGGEVSTAGAIRYADRQNGYLSMVFNFDTCWENGAYGAVEKTDEEIKTNLVSLKKLFLKWYESCHDYCDMPLYWLNHDHPRVVSQYGSLKYRKKSAKMLATVLLFLYGTPFIYQGEELGMSNVTYDSLEDFKADVGSYNFIKSNPPFSKEVLLRHLRRSSRINARTPMQWTSEENAGFSRMTPYVKVCDNYKEVNAEGEMQHPDSIWHYYQKAIALRKQLNKLVIKGSLEIPDIDDNELFVFHKEYEGESITVLTSFTERETFYEPAGDYEVLLANQPVETKERIKLGPFGCAVLKKRG